MTTTSAIPDQWADKPWTILATPQSHGLESSHFAVFMATDMCHVHNVFIRGMNSVYLQAPYVKSTADIADLLFYTKTLLACIQAHHDGEERYLFPGLVKLSGDPDVMRTNQAQHAAFHAQMQDFAHYCRDTSPDAYSYVKFKAMIDSFATPLFEHLSDEIVTILELQNYPSKDLKALWARAEKHINDVGGFQDMFPLAFGCIDKGFEGGKHKFPPVPKLANFVVNYWFARKHQSVWRFNPCDMWGTPRPLYFLPKAELEEPKMR